MQREDHGLRCVSPHLGQLAFQAFAGPSEPSKRILDSNRPVGAGDYQTLLAGASIEARLTQAESAFDDIGNVLGDPCLPLIFECLFGSAGGHEARSRRGGGWNWVGVVSGLPNPNDSGVGALEWRPRHDEG